jgi:hypothetical protein
MEKLKSRVLANPSMVGRENELKELQDALNSALEGVGKLFLFQVRLELEKQDS